MTTRSILIVCGSEFVKKYIHAGLQHSQVRSVYADSAAEALSFALSEVFETIIIDSELKDSAGKDLMLVFSRLSKTKTVPIIYISKDQSDHENACLVLGNDSRSILKKDLSPKLVHSTLEDVFTTSSEEQKRSRLVFVVSAQRRTGQTLGELCTLCGYEALVISEISPVIEKMPRVLPDAIVVHCVLRDDKSSMLAKLLANNSFYVNVPVIILGDDENIIAGINLFATNNYIGVVNQPVSPEVLQSQIEQLSEIKEQKAAMGRLESILIKLLSEYETNRKQKEEIESELVEQKLYPQTFLPRLSMRLREPISEIISFAEVARSRANSAEEVQEALSSIAYAGQELLSLADSCSYLADLEKVNPVASRKPVPSLDLVWRLQEYFLSRSSMSDLKCDFKVNGALPREIDTDPNLLFQIVSHLVANAFKFTTSGAISLVVEFEKESSTLLFTVSDTGVGMSQAMLERLFQAPGPGESNLNAASLTLGIGLPFVGQVAEMLGGSVIARSIEGVGSTFTIQIKVSRECILHIEETPLVEGRQSYDEQKAVDPQSISGTILICDKSLAQRRLYEFYFRPTNVKYEFARDFSEFVRAARGDKYDLFLIDSHSLLGADSKLLTELKAHHMYHPIIAVVPTSNKKVLKNCYEYGCNAALVKPIEASKMYRLLSVYLNEQVGSALESEEIMPVTSPVVTNVPDEPKVLLPDTMDLLADIGPMLLEFIDSLPGVLQQLKNALLVKNQDQARKIIREFSGNCSLFGYEKLADKSQELIEGLVNDDKDKLTTCIDQLDSLVLAVLAGRGQLEHRIGPVIDTEPEFQPQAPRSVSSSKVPRAVSSGVYTVDSGRKEEAKEFILSFSEDYERIRSAYKEENLRRVAFVTNEIAGIAAMSGLAELCEDLLEIERLCHTQNLSNIAVALERVRNMVDNTAESLGAVRPAGTLQAVEAVSQQSVDLIELQEEIETVSETRIIESELLKASPDLRPLIEEFIVEAGNLKVKAISAVNSAAWNELREIAHEAAGAAGMYGYPEYQKAAKSLQKAAEEQNGNATEGLLAELERLYLAMQRGI